MDLSSAFPSDFKDKHLENSVKEGCIISHYDSSIKPIPKYKFIVIASSSNDDSLVVYINSEINSKFNKSFKERGLHIPIKKIDYPEFLKHDSYIDCCHPVEMKLSELRKEVSISPDRKLGELSTELHLKIINNLENAGTVTTKLKAKYGITENVKKPKIEF